jgi:hypothetical protein
MVNKKILWGMAVLVLTFGLVLGGCASGPKADTTAEPIDLVGTTWVYTVTGVSYTLEFQSATSGSYKGGLVNKAFTYSQAGNTVNVNISGMSTQRCQTPFFRKK